MKKLTLALAAALSLSTANAADYVIDSKGAHASINFKIQHLGYSWLTGRFNDFKGTFSYDDAAPSTAKIKKEYFLKIKPKLLENHKGSR